MLNMRPYVPSNRIAIRDSIDEDISDDVDDEVFIKDSKTLKLNEEKGLKRPLMAPRRKNGKSHLSTPIMKKHRRCCWRCCEPFCYGLAALTIVIALISLVALILTMVPVSMQKIKVWLIHQKVQQPTLSMALNDGQRSYGDSMGSEFVPCTQISVQKLWTRTFPRMNSESPVRKADLNGDGVMDIVFGFGVDDNIQYEGYALPKCKSPVQGDEVPCEGGVISVNGANGDVLWQTWSTANVFSLLCNTDINRDGYIDCVAAGRLGMIFAIDGRNGNSIWYFHEVEVETNSPIVMDLYTINIVRDLDGDEIPEIIAVHLEEREESKAGHIKVISGKTGKVIRTIPTPFKEEVFVPVQIITKEDGTELLLIITGGQSTPGGVYTIRLMSLMKYTSEKEFTPLYQHKHSGLMVPSVLTDITGDKVADIVVSSFNSTILAFDGRNFSMLWNFTFPASESVSAIVPGHFNHDDVPDFMVKYNTGPGFPVYYYSQTTILDGKTGQPLLNSMMTDSGGSNSLLGGVSISQTFGGDFYLHWQMQCRDKYDAKDAYEFVPDSDIILQARADTCRLRYNASSVVKLYAIARHIEPPGAVLFSTDDLEVRLNRTQHVTSATIPHKTPKSPLKHPKLLRKLLANKELLEKVVAAEKLENLEKSKNIFRQETARNRLLPPELIQEALDKNESPPAVDTYEALKQLNAQPYYGGYAGNSPLREFVQKDYELDPQRVPEDYENAYPDPEVAQIIPPNEHPIRLRSKYPGNRDIRSDVVYNAKTNSTTNFQNIENPLNNPGKEEPISLWDLEREKEERDVLKKQEEEKEQEKIEEIKTNEIGEDQNQEGQQQLQQEQVDQKQNQQLQEQQQQFTDPQAEQQFEDLQLEQQRRRKRDNIATDSPNVSDDDWFLASISSTGVLMKSLNGTRSSIDFAFVLNIRESEAFPPLFLPQDLNCVEEKMSAYKSYTMDNQRTLRRQFLKQCLNDRLVNIAPGLPRYESQLVITRLSITCTCRSLQPGEVCSELDDIQTQRWTEFMGNDGNGFYRP